MNLNPFFLYNVTYIDSVQQKTFNLNVEGFFITKLLQITIK